MAPPRFFLPLLLLLAIGHYRIQAQKLSGCADTTCAELDQDDTGLIQSPVRQKVEVTKARGIVGNSMGQEGGEGAHRGPAAPLVSTAKDSASLVQAVAPQEDAASRPEPVAPKEDAASKLEPVAPKEDAASKPEPVAAAPIEETDKHKIEHAAPPLSVLQTQDSAPSGLTKLALEETSASSLSFFQMGEEEHKETLQDQEDAVEKQDPDWDEDAADGGDLEAAGVKDPVSDLRMQFGQVLVLLAAITVLMYCMTRWQASSGRPRDALSARMRKKLEGMHLATGPEIRSVVMEGVEGDATEKPDIPMRIQGRVVSKSTADMVAPLSGRSCVLYSASVSQHRHDGVHQPPVAFDSAARDFAIQLEDCPEMLLEVNSQDVFPFDMETGRYACELSFRDAPDAWRGFTLGHLVPNVEACGPAGQSMNRVDLGSKGPLNFRECALVLGSRVTCVGEVIREHNGKLRLGPWSPAPDLDAEETKSRSISWLTPEAEPWRHKLMISDDSRLLTEASLVLPGKCRSCTGAIA